MYQLLPMTGRRDASGAGVGSAILGWVLTLTLSIPVAGFLLFAAFSPATLAVPLVPGKPATAWFVYGLAIIALSLMLGGFSVLVANRAAGRKGLKTIAGLLLLCGLVTPAAAAEPGPAPGMNITAVGLFLVLLAGTLVITWWAARRTQSAKDS